MYNEEHHPGLTDRFEAALILATRLHASQNRKESHVPYIAHLLGVTALVMEDGGDEDQAIAALLHDAVEDQGGLDTLEEIRRHFGERVAEIVDACTDTYLSPKPPWRQRKMEYLEHLHHASPEVRRVSLADKYYNALAILATLHSEGESTWKRFRGGKEGTLWYYQRLAEIFRATGDDFLTQEFLELVARIERFSKDKG